MNEERKIKQYKIAIYILGGTATLLIFLKWSGLKIPILSLGIISLSISKMDRSIKKLKNKK